MQKKYISLGLMSGTSGDGVDASLIISNGIDQIELLEDKYFEYDSNIYQKFHSTREKIFNLSDLQKYSEKLSDLEREITLFHAKVIKEFEKIREDFLVGFHGQTIYHNSEEKISKQLGDGKLLHQLTKKKIIYNFRKNDILNGGEGAPLTPIFHQLISSKKKIDLPVCILNIGGISNVTIIKKPIGSLELFSKDIGPGNCLIDEWVRKNSDKKFDFDGLLASNGKKNEIIIEQALNLYSGRSNIKKRSLDTRDFDISFSRGLSLEDGAATLTDFSASIIGDALTSIIKTNESQIKNIVVCGGGRKNSLLMKLIKNYTPKKIYFKLIDEYGIDGDFVESQAFAYLAIRSSKKLPISFPTTTSCSKPSTGGEIIEN